MEIITIISRLKSYLNILVLICMFSLYGNSQQWTHTGDGLHEFQSSQQPQNLSFYLFDDGYHSFSQNPHHQYGESKKDPVHYSAIPYNGGGVDELVMDQTTEFSTSAVPEMTFPDNQVSIKRSWELVQDKDNYYVITFENSQYTHPISGCLEFHYSKDYSDIEPDEILDHNHYDNGWVHSRESESSDYSSEGYTSKYTWQFENLNVGEQRYVYVNVNCLPPALTRVKTRAVMKVNNTENGCGVHIPSSDKTDGNNSDVNDSNIYTDEAIVKNNPHDPNCIIAEPNGLYECDVNQTITYKIFFHNDGEDPAVNVYLDMKIFAPYQNVKLIKASDNCNLIWDNDKIEIGFYEIYLAGLNDDPAPTSIDDTYGAVEIEVCYDLSDCYFNDNDCLQQTVVSTNNFCADTEVGIRFDFEDPIFVHNSICRNIECGTNGLSNINNGMPVQNSPCPESPSIQSNYFPHSEHNKSDNSKETNLGFTISPNPGYDLIMLDNIKLDENAIIQVYDNTGQKVQKIDANNLKENNTLDISNLESGIYFISVISNSERNTKRFVKI